jgi:ABC-type multidrug transport system ATPase subunit
MTAQEYLELFADLFAVAEGRRRIEELTERTDLAGYCSMRVYELSRGMRQKLSIVRALLPDPDLLILDEPISGLDPLGIKQVRDLILSENREGRTILICSHQLSEMERVCDRVGIISGGKLLVEDSMDSLLGRMTPDREIRVELESIPERLAEELRALPFVTGASAEGKTVVARIARGRDYRRELSEHLIGRGLVPLAITERTPSLEEAFITITQDNVRRLAGGDA